LLLTFDFQLLDFFVHRVPTASGAEFLDLQPVLVLLLVLRRRIIAVLAFTALERNDIAHNCFSLRLSAIGFQPHVLLTAER
jgi:hypothetical protein